MPHRSRPARAAGHELPSRVSPRRGRQPVTGRATGGQGRQGHGDRWLAGDRPDGVHFSLHERVRVVDGPAAGRVGLVLLLVRVEPEPSYLVRLDDDGALRRLAQSRLVPA